MFPQSEASHQEPKSSSLNRKDPSSRGIECPAKEHWAAQRRVAAWKSALRRQHQQTAMSEPLTFASEEVPSKTYWHAHRPPVAHCCLSAVSRYRRTFDKASTCISFILFISFQVPVVHGHIGWWTEAVGGYQEAHLTHQWAGQQRGTELLLWLELVIFKVKLWNLDTKGLSVTLFYSCKMNKWEIK